MERVRIAHHGATHHRELEARTRHRDIADEGEPPGVGAAPPELHPRTRRFLAFRLIPYAMGWHLI